MSQSECPVCAAPIALAPGVEVAEMLACAECGSKVVVKGIDGGQVVLQAAPKVEEDWGE